MISRKSISAAWEMISRARGLRNRARRRALEDRRSKTMAALCFDGFRAACHPPQPPPHPPPQLLPQLLLLQLLPPAQLLPEDHQDEEAPERARFPFLIAEMTTMNMMMTPQKTTLPNCLENHDPENRRDAFRPADAILHPASTTRGQKVISNVAL